MILTHSGFLGFRNTVWSMLALTAEDQLRQRMAWALSQILVISPTLLRDRQSSEATLQYYDIFVRNAFGSYRDILKQVAFSHSMGAMLSSVDNKSYQYLIYQIASKTPDYSLKISNLSHYSAC